MIKKFLDKEKFKKKYYTWKTLNLSMCADRSTNTKNSKKRKKIHVSWATYHLSCVMCYLPPVICHLLSFTCNLTTTICRISCYESPKSFGDAAVGGLLIDGV